MQPTATRILLLPALSAALAYGPAFAAAPDACAARLASGNGGKTVEERVQFLRTGQSTICPRSLESAKCEEDFSQMIQALERARSEAREACARLAGGGASSTGASSFADQRAQLAAMRASLERLHGHFSGTEEKMKAIRQHALHTVLGNLDSAKASRPLEVEAKAAVFQAARPTADVEELRTRVLALNVPALHQDVNTLWVAVNALELEQYSSRQAKQLEAGLAEAGRAGAETAGRQDRLGPVNGSGASNPLGGLLSSPALPGLLGAAAQLAAASKGSSGASSPPPGQGEAGAQAGPAGSSSAPPGLPPSKLDEPARGSADAAQAADEKKEEEKKAEDDKNNLPVTYSAGDSGISGEPPRFGGKPNSGPASAAAKAPGGGGLGGGGDSGEDARAEDSAAEATPARAPASEPGFVGVGGVGGAYGGGSSSSESLFGDSGKPLPSTPATDALAAILGDPEAEPGEEGESQAAPEGPAGESEPTLFALVHAAYVRGLKEGRLDNSRPYLSKEK